MKDFKLSPDDPRLTAYALGELPAEERAAIEAALAHDPEARAFVAQTRAFAEQMRSALAHEPELEDAETGAAAPLLEAELGAAPGREKRQGKLPEYEESGPKFLRFPQLYFIVGGLAAAGFAVMVALRDEAPRYVTKYVEVDLKPHGPQAAAMAQKPEATVAADTAPQVAAPAAIIAANAEMRRNASESRLKEEANQIASTVDVSLLADTKSGLPTQWTYAARNLAAADASTFSVPAPAPDKAPLTLASALGYSSSVQLSVGSAGAVSAAGAAGAAASQNLSNTGSFTASGPAPSVDKAKPEATDALQLASPGEMFGRARDASSEVAVSGPPPDETITLSAFAVATPAKQSSTTGKRVTAGAVDAPVAASTLAGTRVGATDVGIALPPDLLSASVPNPNARPSPSYAASFVSAPVTPIASFWIPTDTGSYDAIRSAIDAGRLPAPDAVRIEELLNRFPWHGQSPAKDGDLSGPLLTATLEAAEAPWAPTHRLVRIGVRAADVKAAMTAQAKGGRVIAKDVKFELEFNPRRVALYRLIGYEQTSRPTDRPMVAGAAAGRLEAGRTITALFEVVPVVTNTSENSAYEGTYAARHLVSEERARPAAQLFTLHVQYRNAVSGVSGGINLPFVDNDAVFAAASDDFKFAAGVAAYGMVLRDSRNRGNATLEKAIAWASAGVGKAGEGAEGGRGEFIDLMRRTRALMH